MTQPDQDAGFSRLVEKPWGSEVIFTPAEAAAVGKLLRITAGHRLSLQYHTDKAETLCLLDGEAELTLKTEDGGSRSLKMERLVGYFIEPGQVHRITALTDARIIEASTREVGDTVRLDDDAGRGRETEEMRLRSRT